MFILVIISIVSFINETVVSKSSFAQQGENEVDLEIISASSIVNNNNRFRQNCIIIRLTVVLPLTDSDTSSLYLALVIYQVRNGNYVVNVYQGAVIEVRERTQDS